MEKLRPLICRTLPRPGRLPITIPEGLRVLLMSSSINNLSRRLEFELQKYKTVCNSYQTRTEAEMITAVQKTDPDLIICPFMTKKVPREIFCKVTRPCFIVHPGIPGDRTMCSLDYAIRDGLKTWGVTILQAEEELDYGDVWCTEEFNMPSVTTKTALYNGAVADAAIRCSIDAVSRYVQDYVPVSLLDETRIHPVPLKRMRNADRSIDWSKSACKIASIVRMSDTMPGAIGDLHIHGALYRFRVFDAYVEDGRDSPMVRHLLSFARPGDVIAQKYKALLVKCGDGQGLWIGHMKKNTKAPTLKLPAVDALKQHGDVDVPYILEPSHHDDVKVRRDGAICYVHFDFYNGAASTEQAVRLQDALAFVRTIDEVQLVALMGGVRFFSTGINLVSIENSRCKQDEAWSNINAFNDVIKDVVTMTDKATVAVLQGNAGAGGAMFAAACDVVVAHPGVLLTPTYRNINLFGSEYWTYFLPRRVGEKVAKRLTEEINPMSAEIAQSAGLVDHIIGRDKESFYEELPSLLKSIVFDKQASKIIKQKRLQRDDDWQQLIQKHRKTELAHMKEDFRSHAFLTAMHNFVYH